MQDGLPHVDTLDPLAFKEALGYVMLLDKKGDGSHFRCDSGMHQGERGQIRFDGFGQSMPFTVRFREKDSVHVEFPANAAFASWIGQRSAGMRRVLLDVVKAATAEEPRVA